MVVAVSDSNGNDIALEIRTKLTYLLQNKALLDIVIRIENI